MNEIKLTYPGVVKILVDRTGESIKEERAIAVLYVPGDFVLDESHDQADRGEFAFFTSGFDCCNGAGWAGLFESEEHSIDI